MVDILKSPEFGQFIANVILGLVAILIPVIGAAVRNLVAANKDDKRFGTFMDIVRVAVLAAEQSGISGQIEDKKEAAIEAAEAMLKSRGMKVNFDALDAAIEAMVADELNRPVINEANYQKSQGAA